MKVKWYYYVIATTVLIVGIGGQLLYDFYIKPYVFAETVVKVRAADTILAKNYKLQEGDLYLDKVQTADIPLKAIVDVQEAVGKILNVDITDGTILTESLVDVDNLMPGEQEGIFPIPKSSIYAINGSLRSRDLVDIYVIDDSQKSPNDQKRDLLNQLNGEEVTVVSSDRMLPKAPILEKIPVVYVRSDDNNDVLDSDKGNTNRRFTSTATVSEPEIKMTNEQALIFKDYLDQGYKFWFVRVE